MDATTASVLTRAIHDLRGPSSRIHVMAQMLGRKPGLDDDSRQLITHIEDSATAVAAIANGLRKYVELCGRTLSCERLELDAALDSALSHLESEIAATQTRITRSPLPAVHGDGFLLSWLFQELLSNAIHARGERSLEIEIAAHGPEIRIRDNGPGLGEGMAERIFRPFEKIAPGPTSGMGLTICRDIVERHGGRIWAEETGEGAEFRLSF